MIRLTRRNGEPIVINVATIAYIETVPDTLVTLTTGEHIHVKEPVEDIIGHVLKYQRRVASGSFEKVG